MKKQSKLKTVKDANGNNWEVLVIDRSDSDYSDYYLSKNAKAGFLYAFSINRESDYNGNKLLVITDKILKFIEDNLFNEIWEIKNE